MSVTPKLSLVAFGERTGDFIFVAIPDQRGRYLRTDKSVAVVACRQCKASIGMPCTTRGGDGWSSTTHSVRRSDAKHLPNRRAADDVTTDAENQTEELVWPELPPV